MKERFRQFMYGRYGTDAFNRFLSICTLVCLVLGLLSRRSVFLMLGLFLIVVSYFRMFSRNTARRYQENIVYEQVRQVVTGWLHRHTDKLRTALHQRKVRFQNRKQYRYFHCPHCRQALRVPRGRGKVEVSCPKCHTSFLGKT